MGIIWIKWYWSFRLFNLFLNVTLSQSDSVMLPFLICHLSTTFNFNGKFCVHFLQHLTKGFLFLPLLLCSVLLILLRDLPFYASDDGEVTWGSGRPCQERARASSPGGVVCFRFLVARSDVTTPSLWAGADELAGATGPFHYLHALFQPTYLSYSGILASDQWLFLTLRWQNARISQEIPPKYQKVAIFLCQWYIVFQILDVNNASVAFLPDSASPLY